MEQSDRYDAVECANLPPSPAYRCVTPLNNIYSAVDSRSALSLIAKCTPPPVIAPFTPNGKDKTTQTERDKKSEARAGTDSAPNLYQASGLPSSEQSAGPNILLLAFLKQWSKQLCGVFSCFPQ